ncbi:hypothetical protein VCM39_13540 [Bacteroides sp. CG01]|uniref:hypothetical protein n=1 Tax=Bacteroides sp. CG01 TaxID=3096000 RepID=UPI002AFE15F2|nr:hypothetical protein [Bacteroides sp. CG01]
MKRNKQTREQSMLKLDQDRNITIWVTQNIDGLVILHLECPIPEVYKHLSIIPGGDPKRVIVSAQEADIYKTKGKGLIIDAFTDPEQLNVIYRKAGYGLNTISKQIAGYVHKCRFRLQ